MTEYFETAIIWSTMGLIVGFMAGVGVRVTWLNGVFQRRDRDRLVGLTLILIALIAIAQNIIFQRHQREFTACQARYNAAFQITLKERSSIADKDKDNLSFLINGIVTAKNREDSRKIFLKYVATNKALDDQRKSYKYPELPQKACK